MYCFNDKLLNMGELVLLILVKKRKNHEIAYYDKNKRNKQISPSKTFVLPFPTCSNRRREEEKKMGREPRNDGV